MSEGTTMHSYSMAIINSPTLTQRLGTNSMLRTPVLADMALPTSLSVALTCRFCIISMYLHTVTCVKVIASFLSLPTIQCL